MLLSMMWVNKVVLLLITERRGGLIVDALDSGSRGPDSRPGRWCWCCVLGQDSLLSQCLSPLKSINGYQKTVRET